MDGVTSVGPKFGLHRLERKGARLLLDTAISWFVNMKQKLPYLAPFSQRKTSSKIRFRGFVSNSEYSALQVGCPCAKLNSDI